VDYVLDKSYCGEEVFSEECAMSESKSLWKRFVDYWSLCPFCFAGSLPASKTGTQGLKNAYDRGALPFELCTEIAEVVEKERKVYKELVL
jgi:hypothetical protein